jgi:hypothetical protein
MSAAHYVGDELMGDYAVDGTKMKFVSCDTPEICQTVGQFQKALVDALQPLFRKHGVDLYNAGHVHSYESTWPLCDFLTGALCRATNGTWLQSLDEPKGTVHVTEGNGGVPGVPGTYSATSCTVPPTEAAGWPGCHTQGTGGAYGRMAATPTTLTYTRVANPLGMEATSPTAGPSLSTAMGRFRTSLHRIRSTKLQSAGKKPRLRTAVDRLRLWQDSIQAWDLSEPPDNGARGGDSCMSLGGHTFSEDGKLWYVCSFFFVSRPFVKS